VALCAAPFLFLPGLGVNRNVVKKKAAHKKSAHKKSAHKKAAHKKAAHKAEEVAARQATEQDNGGTEQQAGKETGKKKKVRPVPCIHRHTDVEFRREFPKVFEALVEKAKEGGTAETRLLLQIGRFGEPKAARRRRGKSLSEMLLDELKRRQDEREAAADNERAAEQMALTKEGSEGATSDGDGENKQVPTGDAVVGESIVAGSDAR
jgi:hypothetical protein